MKHAKTWRIEFARSVAGIMNATRQIRKGVQVLRKRCWCLSLFCSKPGGRRIRRAAASSTAVFLAVPALLTVTGAHAQAQDTIRLDQFRECPRCTVVVKEVARLGTADGPGMIEADRVEVRPDPTTPGYLAFHFGQHAVKLFRADGTFVKSIGREGRGPGEIGRIRDVARSGTDLIVIDGTGKSLVLDSTGAVLYENRLSILDGRIRVIGGDSVVMASMDRRPRFVGFPLHLIDVATGSVLRHIGGGGDWSVREPFSTSVILGHSSGRSSWWARPNRLKLEELDLTGDLLRVVEGELEWFPALLRPPPERGPPPTLLIDFAVTPDQFLFLLTNIADRRWRTVLGSGQSEFYITRQEELDRYFDSRIDVFDLASRTYVGSRTWDSAAVVLGLRPDTVGVFVGTLKYNSQLVPSVAISTIVPVVPPRED